MKRLYLAAFAGLCAVSSLRAQDGYLAPTAPVVPPPMLHNGSVVAPAGSWGGGGPFARHNWSPVRSPVVPADAAYIGQAPCGPAGCGPQRSCLERLKAWLCFQYTPTELPKLRPTPYTTPIQGLFGCSSSTGCTSCAVGGYPAAVPVGQPMPPAPAPLQMPAPMKPPAGAGAVLMPPRGTQGTATAWATAPTEFGTVKTTSSQSWQKPAQAPVVNTGYRVPQK